jgi:hypothetical protein
VGEMPREAGDPAVAPMAEVLVAIGYLPDTADALARQLLSALAQRGWVLYRAEGGKVRNKTAIAQAREHLRASESRFVRTGAEASMAESLQGILLMLIEQQETTWDTPCDCFAGMPQIEGFAEAKPEQGKE